MKLYRKRPVTVEATQWTGDNAAELQDFTDGAFYQMDEDDRANSDDPDHTGSLYVAANSRWLGLPTGEFIIHDAAGFYSCKADIFAATYEPVL